MGGLAAHAECARLTLLWNVLWTVHSVNTATTKCDTKALYVDTVEQGSDREKEIVIAYSAGMGPFSCLGATLSKARSHLGPRIDH